MGGDPPRLRALMVDSDVGFLEEASSLLREEGLYVEVASEPGEALRLMEDSPPFDLIFCEAALPAHEGRSVLEMARALPHRPSVLALAEAEASFSAGDLPGLPIVFKPIDPVDLSRTVAWAVHTRHAGVEGLSPALANALYQMATAANSEPSLSQLLNRLLRLCLSGLGAESGSVMVASNPGPNGRTLSIVASHGLEVRASYAPVVVGSTSVSGWVAKNLRPLRLLGSLQSYPQFKALPPNPRVNEALIAPIAFRRELMGIISLGSKRQGQLGAEKLAFVINAADIAAAAIHRDRLERSREHQDRLAVLGQLSASVAHELNNPLTYIRSNLANLNEVLMGPPGPLNDLQRQDMKSLVSESLDGVDRMVALISNLKGASRKTPGSQQRVDVPTLLRRAAALVHSQVKHRVVLEVLPGEPVQVRGDAGRLLQVLINLMVNASQAVTDNGRVILRSVNTESTVVIAVEDNGPGIPAEVGSHIFEPFFTTKPEGEGTGLGLSISQQIAIEHGGTLSFTSESGKGTCFHLELPQDTQKVELAMPVAMLVDDDPAQLRAVKRLLDKRFEVLTAEGPIEALRVARERKLDLVVTDYAMPEQNGIWLVHTLRAHGHLARAILVTSLDNNEIQQALAQGLIEAMVSKPINPEVLISEAERVMHHASLGQTTASS